MKLTEKNFTAHPFKPQKAYKDFCSVCGQYEKSIIHDKPKDLKFDTDKMDKKPENPSAFPLAYKREGKYGGGCNEFYHGATLLDYFAAKAMPAIMYGFGTGKNEDEIAEKAYKNAKAMLKERQNHL